MISYHKGDLLESGCDIICHQVNLDGVMGGGLALQIATKYPEVEQDYKMFCEDWNKYANLGGEVLFSEIYGTNNYIANCFSQDEDFTTRYDWLKECIEEIKRFIGNGKCKVGIPQIMVVASPKETGIKLKRFGKVLLKMTQILNYKYGSCKWKGFVKIVNI